MKQAGRLDGNFDKSRNRVRIYTNSYKKNEVEILADSIYKKLNIKYNIREGSIKYERRTFTRIKTCNERKR